MSMFLRGKKPDGVLKQSKDKEPDNKPNKQKALGGWQDDEPANNQQETDNVPSISSTGNTSEATVQETVYSKPTKKDEFRLYTVDELSDQLNLEYENKLVDEVTQPGGIRIKPNETLLVEFCKAAKTLDVPVIGSLLISRLEMDLSYAIKAKALYTMEYISKKLDKYAAYFRRHMEYIKGLPVPSDNEQQYQTLLEDISKSILGEQKSNKEGSSGLLEFTDPGYNVPLKKEPQSGEKPIFGLMNKPSDKPKVQSGFKGPSKTFISPEEMKKKKQEQTKKGESLNILDAVPSPQTAPKQPEKVDIFSLGDLSGLSLNGNTTTTETKSPVPPPGSFNLYDMKQPTQPQPQYYPQPGAPVGYYPYGYPYGQMPQVAPGNPQYPGVYNGQPYPQPGYQYGATPAVNSVPITGANLYGASSK